MTEKLPFSIDEFLFQIHFHFHSGHKLIFYTFFVRFLAKSVQELKRLHTLYALVPWK